MCRQTCHRWQAEWWPSKNYVYLLTPRTFKCDLIWRKGLCRSSWTTQVGSQSNEKCVLVRDRRGKDTDTQRRREDQGRGQQYADTSPGTPGATRAERGNKGPPPERPKSETLPTPRVRTSGSRTERTHISAVLGYRFVVIGYFSQRSLKQHPPASPPSQLCRGSCEEEFIKILCCHIHVQKKKK